MKAVLFDLGHTLINYNDEWRAPEQKAIANFASVLGDNVTVDAEEVRLYLADILSTAREKKIKELVEVPLIENLVRCMERFGCEDEDVLASGLELFYDQLQEKRKIIDGAKETLERVKELDYSVGLVSDVAWGLPSEFPLRDIEFYGLEQYFDDMVFSTDIGLRKPHPKVFKIALSNLGASASEAVFVGNNLQADIKGALGVGMRAVLKESTFYVHDDEIVPTAKISAWDEFESVLESL